MPQYRIIKLEERERVVSHRMKFIHFSCDCSSSALPTSFESAGVEACTGEEAVSEANNSPAAEPPAPMAVVTAAATAGAVLTDIDDHMLPSMSQDSTNFLKEPVRIRASPDRMNRSTNKFFTHRQLLVHFEDTDKQTNE